MTSTVVKFICDTISSDACMISNFIIAALLYNIIIVTPSNFFQMHELVVQKNPQTLSMHALVFNV